MIGKGDKQVPAWFNKKQQRVKLVRHKEIFKDLTALPTYNSHAIEANLYNIEGLARFFLYVELQFVVSRTRLTVFNHHCSYQNDLFCRH